MVRNIGLIRRKARDTRPPALGAVSRKSRARVGRYFASYHYAPSGA